MQKFKTFFLIFSFFFLITAPVYSKESVRKSGGKSYAAGERTKVILEEKSSELSEYSIEKTKNGSYIVKPVQNPAKTGFIFYPGGKVECEAYLPIVTELAKKGYLTILYHMPMDLAVLDINAAADAPKTFPEIEHWYIGGHSLGGAMAADYAANKPEVFEGIVLLAAYSQKSVDSKIKVLAIYGSCDGVMNSENYEKYRKNLPADFREVIIDGGCHSYFGDYGMQAGDGVPEITWEEQFKITIDEICRLMSNKK